MPKAAYSILVGYLLVFILTGVTYFKNKHVELQSTIQLDVPFTSQAPFADWGDPYQEACEEASLIMVHNFLKKSDLSKEDADKEIIDITSWIADQGMAEDITTAQLAIVAQKYYGYNTTLIENPTIEDLKKEISAGHPVIVPAAGRQLGNPYFSGEGPWYHMLVLTGYDHRSFITNDPGTRRGEKYKYKFNTLYESIHDWTGVKEDIGNGPKVALIVY